MKKHVTFTIVLAILSLFACMINNADASDILIENAVATDVVNKLDKKGNAYTRIIIKEERTIQGHKYEATVPVMFFGKELSQQAAEIQKGQAFSVIAQKRDYRGRESYTALAILN